MGSIPYHLEGSKRIWKEKTAEQRVSHSMQKLLMKFWQVVFLHMYCEVLNYTITCISFDLVVFVNHIEIFYRYKSYEKKFLRMMIPSMPTKVFSEHLLSLLLREIFSFYDKR